MKHDPALFDARTLHNDTRLLFKLKLLLGTVCAYGGEVPLSHSELAKRMGTSGYRVNILLQKLLQEEIVRYDDYGRLFFNKFKFIQDKEESTTKDLYAKCFSFFTCEEFLSEERIVQRFVLHYVGKELVYIPGNWRWGKISDLHGYEGLLNIRTRKEAVDILEKAKKYLEIKVFNEDYQVINVKPVWLAMGEVHSEGAELWVWKQLRKHRFCCDFISRKAVWQLAKVMEDYYSKYLFMEDNSSIAADIFDFALHRIQEDRMASHMFLTMIYKNDEEYIVTEEKNELDEISAYFRKVMENAELEYAEQMVIDLKAIQNKRNNAEYQLFNQAGELSKVNEQVISEAKEQRDAVWKKLLELHHCWLKRIDVKPDWFIENRYRIFALSEPILEIKNKIRTKLEAEDRFRNPWSI